MLIMKVRAIKTNNVVRQLIVTIPKDSNIKEGEYVLIVKISPDDVIESMSKAKILHKIQNKGDEE